jgi:hypothetical protein
MNEKCTIQFYNGYSWENRPKTTIKRMIDLDIILERLGVLRAEWEEAAQGKPLEDVKGSVGLLLDDFYNLLELLPEERSSIPSSQTAEEAT